MKMVVWMWIWKKDLQHGFFGLGVRKIRIHAENEYRILYVAGSEEALFVLHAFAKKTQKTPKRDLDLAKERFELVVKGRG